MNGAEVLAFAEMIRRVFATKGFNGDGDDVAQDTAVHVLEAHRRKRVPMKGNRGYYYQVAVREGGITIGRQLSALSCGETTAQKRGREWADRTQLVGCGGRAEDGAVELLDDDTMPDARRRRDDAADARARLWGIFEDYLRTMPEADRRVLGMLLGIGTPQRDPDEVTVATGRPAPAVWATVRRLKKVIANDRGARRARRVMIQHQEDAAA